MKKILLIFGACFLSACGSSQSSSSQSAATVPDPAQVQTEASPSPSPSPKGLFSSWVDPISGKTIDLTTAQSSYIVIQPDEGNGTERQEIQIGDAGTGNFVLGNGEWLCLEGDQNCTSYGIDGIGGGLPWSGGTYSYSLANNVLHVCNSEGLCWDLE